jgi:CRP/FNR family transcriptional regulator, cyclic AMP receptor protein
MVSIEMLRSCSYFAGVSNESLRAVAAFTEERHFIAGEVLFKEGDLSRGLYILRQGQVDIVYRLHGGEERVVDTVVAGDLIGWSSLVEPYRSTAIAVAREAGGAIWIAAAGIRDLCEKDHTLGYHLLKQLAGVLSRRLQGALVQLAASS